MLAPAAVARRQGGHAMTSLLWIRIVFVVAAVYDGVLGLAFLLAGPRVYASYGVTPPNHWGYVQFPALLLLVFAAMFAAVARDPAGQRNLIPYGIGLKIAYCGLTLYYWLSAGLPGMWKPFTVIDAIMIVLFAVAYAATGRPAKA
jgi:hypothetical protein